MQPLAITILTSLAGIVRAQSQPSFVDISTQVEVASKNPEPLLSFGDYDHDGDPDLLVDGRRLFRNDSGPAGIHFHDVTEQAGLQAARGPSGCWFDFDLDGYLDIGTASGEVWINTGKGGFRNFSEQLGIKVPHGKTSAASWGDVNGDGWLDLVTGGDTTYNPLKHYAQSCWLNSPRKRPLRRLKRERDIKKLTAMRDVSKTVGIDTEMYGRSIIFCDYDWDGDQDIYSGNYHLKANYLLQNNGGVFTNVAEVAGAGGVFDQTMFTIPSTDTKIGFRYGHTIGATWADLNNDGYFDLWVANLAHKFTGERSNGKFDTRGYVCGDSNLYINQGPPAFAFEDGRQKMGIPCRPIGDRGTFRGDELWSNSVCGDLDNNGWIDTFVNQIYRDLSYSYGLLFMNDEGQYREQHEPAGITIWGGYGSAFADLDSDGRLDIVACGANTAKGPPTINFFHNQTEPAAWIGFDVVTAKGVQTVGVKMLLIQEHGVQLRQIQTTMGSHGQQNDGRLHFGLGDNAEILDVLLYWPNGGVDSLGTPAIGKYHSVQRRNKRKKRIKVTMPTTVTVGAPANYAATIPGKGWHYYWNFEGSRLPEASNTTGDATHTFSDPGVAFITVTAVHPRLTGSELRLQVDVADR